MLAEEEPAVLVRTLEVIELEDQATLKVFSLDDVATTAAAQLAAAITAINQTTGGSVSPGPAGFVAPAPAAGAAAAAAAGKGGAPAASPTGAVVVATPAAKRGGRFASMRERCLHALEMLIARQFQPLAQSEEEVERKLGELDAKRKVIEERKAQEMEVAAEKARIAARLAETEKKEARLAAKGKGKRGRAGGAGGDDWDDEPPSDISSDNSGDSLDLDRIRIDSDDDNRPARAKPKPKPGATAGKGGAGKGGRKGSDVPNYFDDLDDSDGGGGGGGAGKSKPATDAAARRRNRSEDDDSGGSDADSRGSSADGDGSDGKGGRGSTGVRIVGQTAAQAASMSPSPGQQRKGDYLSGVLQKLRGVMGDLEGLDSATRCFPPAYNIRDFFLKRYAKWCRTVLQFHLADMSRLTKQSTLDVILFIEWFLDEMLRLGAEKGPADEYDITIKELVGRYVDSTRKVGVPVAVMTLLAIWRCRWWSELSLSRLFIPSPASLAPYPSPVHSADNHDHGREHAPRRGVNRARGGRGWAPHHHGTPGLLHRPQPAGASAHSRHTGFPHRRFRLAEIARIPLRSVAHVMTLSPCSLHPSRSTSCAARACEARPCSTSALCSQTCASFTSSDRSPSLSRWVAPPQSPASPLSLCSVRGAWLAMTGISVR